MCSELNTHWEIFNRLSLPRFLLPLLLPTAKRVQATLCSPQTGKWPEWQAAHPRGDYTRKPREVGTVTGLKQVYQRLKNLALLHFQAPEVRVGACYSRLKFVLWTTRSSDLLIGDGAQGNATGSWIIYSRAWQETSSNLYFPSGCNLKD